MSNDRGTGGFLHPERIVGYFEIRPGMIVADFGAGGGYFSIPLARLVGEHGKVYSIDVQKPALDLIRSKAEIEHLRNIETVWADLELAQGSRLASSSCDLVVVSNILFQVQNKAAVISESSRVLKSGGRLVILEWDEMPFSGGPPQDLRVSKSLAKRLAAEGGFQIGKEFEAGSHHYGLMFVKP